MISLHGLFQVCWFHKWMLRWEVDESSITFYDIPMEVTCHHIHQLRLLFLIFNWRIIFLQYCVCFCHASTWISRGYILIYVPSLLNFPPTFHPMRAILTRFSCVQLCVTLWTVARQASLSMGFSRREYWSRLPCPPLGHLPDPGIEPTSLMSPALADRFFTTGTTWEAHLPLYRFLKSLKFLKSETMLNCSQLY